MRDSFGGDGGTMAEHAGDLAPADADPATLVRAFIAAMHDWELSAEAARAAAVLAGENPFDPKNGIRAGQDAVFARFCTLKRRTCGRLGSFCRPPEYQPTHEPVLEVTVESARRTVVQTQPETGFKDRRMYVLLRRGGRWLLDSVKSRRHDGTWHNGVL